MRISDWSSDVCSSDLHSHAGAVRRRPRGRAPGWRHGRGRHRALDAGAPAMSARLTVVGSGFAGMTALRPLRRQDRDAAPPLVAPAAELHYLPATIWLPSGERTRSDLECPPQPFLPPP